MTRHATDLEDVIEIFVLCANNVVAERFRSAPVICASTKGDQLTLACTHRCCMQRHNLYNHAWPV